MGGVFQIVGPNHTVQMFGIRLVGVNAENGKKLLFTLVFLAIVVGLSRLLRGTARTVLGKKLDRVHFWTRQVIRLLVTLVTITGLVSIWFNDPKGLASAGALITAGLAIASQRMITAFAGYFIILRGKNFNVGDRIVMGGVRGDVIAVDFMQTTIMEMGQPPGEQGDSPSMWVGARQYTGRVVTITNDKLFEEPVYNYTREFPYIWDEMRLPISYQTKRGDAERIILEAARRHTTKTTELGEDALAELEDRYKVKREELEPRVFFRMTDNWVEMAVRFIAPDHGIRAIKDAMSRDILDGFDAAKSGSPRGLTKLSACRRSASSSPETACAAEGILVLLPPTASYGYISDEALLSLDSMEGIHQLPHAPAKAAPPKEGRGWAGYLLSVLVAALAYGIHYLPFPPFRVMSASGARYPVSAAIIAIVGGVIVRNLLPLPAAAVESANGLARRIIPITIVLTGAGLNLTRVASVGPRALWITLICIVTSMMTTIWVARAFKLWHRTGLLIGAGTAICGTSAIVAVAPLVEAEDQDLMLSIGTVNILGLLLMFVLPAAGGLLHLKDEAFGVWAGTSIHAVPQVVAAGFAYSAAAGALATLVKLVRVTLLAPFLFVVGYLYARRHGSAVSIPYAKLVPRFVYGFLALSLLNTLGLLPVLQFRFGSSPLADILTNAGELLLTLSMAAMGLEVNVRFLARTGGAAVLTGLAASAVLCAVSLALIKLLL